MYDLNITDCYVGNTTEFTKRKSNQKSQCCNESNQKYNLPLCKFIRDNGGWSNWSMVEIDKYPCSDGNEAKARVRFWYEQLNATLNKQIPNQTKAEWSVKDRVKNKEQIAEYNKEYYNNNKEKIVEYGKEYRENNREKIAECKKEYYENNFDIISAKKSTLYTCDCGTVLCLNRKSRHIKTNFHINYMQSKNSEIEVST